MSQKPLFDIYKDEDLEFVLESYQDAMNPFSTPPAESHARRKLMKKIAIKRAPRAIPLLDQIENIVKRCEDGQLSLEKAMNRLANISAKYGDKNLHNGVLMKIGMINGQKPTERIEKPVALFSFKKEKNSTLIDVLGTTKKKGKKKNKKTAMWKPTKDAKQTIGSLFGGKL
jgi:hypothetical protein